MNRAGAKAAGETPVNAGALYDFLQCLSLSVLQRESGDSLGAGITGLAASAALVGAFPIGSPESRALGCILAAAERVTEDAP